MASSNNGPSSAAAAEIGVPFAGNWPGTIYLHGNYPSHWWRLPFAVRAGDEVQIAADNRQGDRSLYVCLVSPVDDFGADAAFESCGYNSESYLYFESGQQARGTLTYEGPSGRGYLVTWIRDCCYDRGEAVPNGRGQYSGTIEQITTLVNIGLGIPTSLPPTFTLTANLTYGDNTPAADGIPAYLQWRFVAPRGTDPEPFANLITATSVGGTVTFAGSVPIPAEGRKIQLRACVAQPGSTAVRCAESTRTAIFASPCTRALASRRAKSRSVHRLKKRLRRARSGVAKRRIRRKLKKQKRRLAKARRSVRIHCA